MPVATTFATSPQSHVGSADGEGPTPRATSNSWTDVVKPAPFDYVAAESVGHALELLNGDRDARVLAGGQSLLPLLNLRLASPELVVDIGRIPELALVELDGETLVIGAGVTQADTAANPLVTDGWPLLAAAIGHIGHSQIRNQGTVCGSIAHNDPLAELPAVALTLDAEIVVASPDGDRRVPAADMFVGPFMTSVGDGELVRAVRFPPSPANSGWSINEFATRTGDFATAGIAARLSMTDGAVTEASVVMFGLGPGPQRSDVLETALVGATTPTISSDVLEQFDASIEPGDDAHASSASRRELAANLVATSIAEAWERSQ